MLVSYPNRVVHRNSNYQRIRNGPNPAHGKHNERADLPKAPRFSPYRIITSGLGVCRVLGGERTAYGKEPLGDISRSLLSVS
jgi:hypothetical protein